MVKSGTVIELNHADQCGIIEDKQKREYFFSFSECVDDDIPKQWEQVTFIKDSEYKSTDVASLIKRSAVGNRAA